MRLRLRLLAGFVAVHLALSALAGVVAWQWLDRGLRAQAEDSARSVGTVIAGGGFSLSPRVIERMRTLTGYRFRVLTEPEAVRDGTVQVEAGGLVVEIDYRNEAWQHARGQVLWATVLLFLGGTVAFAVVATALAGQFARPVERLAEGARGIAAGAWDTPLPVVGSGEVRALAQELERMRQRLLELDAAHRQAERLATLGTFTATIAHEVRNPLSAVRLTVQLLARRLPGDPGLELINGEIERLDLIVDELLGFSRGMSVRPEPTDLAEVVAGVQRLLRRQADHAGVALVTVDARHPAANGGPLLVLADPQRLRQLLLNLTLNAIQAAQRGAAVDPALGTRVAMTITDDGVAVADDGPGVPPELAQRLFEPFASGRAEGTGLGLHLARTIAEAHGCRLRHEPAGSGKSPGARFVLEGLKPAPADAAQGGAA